MTTVLGADPGQTGAMVWVEGNGILGPSLIFTVRPLPTVVDKKRQVLYDIYAQDAWPAPCFDAAYIEDVHSMPGQGVSSTFKFGYSAGFLRGVIESLAWCGVEHGLEPDVVRIVTPQKWKKTFGLIGQPKEAAISLAQYLFPGQEHLIEDDGVADAALIAYYGWCDQRGELK